MGNSELGLYNLEGRVAQDESGIHGTSEWELVRNYGDGRIGLMSVDQGVYLIFISYGAV